jgi:hypothetical protein
MDPATAALYEPLVERDATGFRAAARAYLQSSSEEELWVAVTRFAVLAYAPSQHGKRAVMACRAAWDMRAALADRWPEMISACAEYAAASRQPWSEPPILDPPPPTDAEPALDELRGAIVADDRLRAERWLSARIHDCERDLRTVARGDAVLMLDAALALLPLLGEHGRFALFRMVVHELFEPGDHPCEPLPLLVDRAVEEKGAVDAVRSVLVAIAAVDDAAHDQREQGPPLEPYPLARDYAQTLIAHSFAPRLSHRTEQFLTAVHENLEHGESYADWA